MKRTVIRAQQFEAAALPASYSAVSTSHRYIWENILSLWAASDPAFNPLHLQHIGACWSSVRRSFSTCFWFRRQGLWGLVVVLKFILEKLMRCQNEFTFLMLVFPCHVRDWCGHDDPCVVPRGPWRRPYLWISVHCVLLPPGGASRKSAWAWWPWGVCGAQERDDSLCQVGYNTGASS